VLGNEVATLVNEEKTPGTYQVSWDGSAQASGVYLYRLQARASQPDIDLAGSPSVGEQTRDFSETKKLVLMR